METIAEAKLVGYVDSYQSNRVTRLGHGPELSAMH